MGPPTVAPYTRSAARVQPAWRRAWRPLLARRPLGRARLWPSDAIPLGDDARSRFCSGPPQLLLPILAYYLWRSVERQDGALTLPGPAFWRAIPLPSAPALLMLGGWVLFQALLEIVAPGRVVQGAALRDGRRLRYRINGWSAWWLTGGALGGLVGLAWALGDPAAALTVATVPADAFGHLMSAAIAVTLALCVTCTAGPDTSGRRGGRRPAVCSTTTSWGRA